MSYAQWSSFAYYNVGDIVGFAGSDYEALQANTNVDPSTLAPNWVEFVPNAPAPTTSYASFFSHSTQVLANGAETILYYDAKSIGSADIDLGSPSTIIAVQTAGKYKVLFSIQVDRNVAGSGDFQAWIRVDGNDVPDTNTQIIVNQNIQTLNTCEFIVNLNAGGTVEVVCWSNSAGQRALAVGATPTTPVDIPSIITNIYKLAP